MSDRPTPRTDAVRFRVGESDHWAVHEVYAKQLERELAEARAWSSKLADLADDLRADLQEEREQRDRLAVIAGELIAAVRVNSMLDTFREATTEQIDEWLKPWVSRLAAIKEKEQG
jgi:hypothetical protein